jgi:hypothetical protein
MLLKELAQDEGLMQLLEQFFMAHLDNLALDRVYHGEKTEGVAVAKEVIDGAFKQLSDLKVEGKIKEPVNMAR